MAIRQQGQDHLHYACRRWENRFVESLHSHFRLISKIFMRWRKAQVGETKFWKPLLAKENWDDSRWLLYVLNYFGLKADSRTLPRFWDAHEVDYPPAFSCSQARPYDFNALSRGGRHPAAENALSGFAGKTGSKMLDLLQYRSQPSKFRISCACVQF